MNIFYKEYDDIDIANEIEKINNADIINLNLYPTDRKCLFMLGVMFAKGKRIKIINENELNLQETKKSFSVMPYVWSKLCDDNFPSKDFSNVVTEMDKRIENVKRLGVDVKPIINHPINKKMFLICPVRNATQEQRKWIEDYVLEKAEDGYKVHAPHLNTVQTDMFGGYAICIQNSNAIASSSEVDIYYDQYSTGSVFDLGVAYSLNKPLVILNEKNIKFNDNDFVDNIVKNWGKNKNQKTKSLSLYK